MSEEPRKRSRFDQTERSPPRKSRFDRRSRSPPRGDDEPSHRNRSPIAAAKSVEGGSSGIAKRDAAAAAAAAAAKINAQLSQKKAIQHVDVPPIISSMSPSNAAGGAKSPPASANDGSLKEEIYQQDGDFIKDIEVNDLRNRYTLTKGSTQKMIKEETGADVTTRGSYYPDKSMATAANPPLYLHVTSTTKDGLEKAVQRIEELMQQELPNLIDERRFRRREPEQVERDSQGRRKWPEERIPIDLEPIPGFNLRAQVVGAGGSFVKHIQGETHCRVQIKGRGSGYVEHDTQRESDEQMYLHVAGPDANEVQNAKEMCESLLLTVKERYEEFKESRNRGPGGGDGYGYGGGGGGGGGGYREERGGYHGGSGGGYHGGGGGGYHGGGRDRQQASGGNSAYNGGGGHAGYGSNYGGSNYGGGSAYGEAQAPTAATPTTTESSHMDATQYQAWVAYYAANPQADPYIQYGGFSQYMHMYSSYMAQSAGSPSQANGAGGAPPPPPPDDGAPPPPPGGAGGSYNAMPPPPGV